MRRALFGGGINSRYSGSIKRPIRRGIQFIFRPSSTHLPSSTLQPSRSQPMQVYTESITKSYHVQRFPDFSSEDTHAAMTAAPVGWHPCRLRSFLNLGSRHIHRHPCTGRLARERHASGVPFKHHRMPAPSTSCPQQYGSEIQMYH